MEKSEEIYILMKDLCKQYNKTFLIVTHDQNLAMKFADSYTYIRHGKISDN